MSEAGSGVAVAIEHEQGAFRLSASFAAPAGVTALFGRSGSGKTTIVNVIGGLLRPRRARIVVGGTVLTDTEAGIFVPRHRRRIGYVFQEGRLFPHLSVRQNLLFGRWFAPRAGGGPALADVVDLLGIGHLLARRPGTLSGGEKQRVAIGRALLARPRLLLMDEPLASLDEERRAEILPFIERLRDEAGVPIVYVSHAMAEVARIADTLVLVEDGRVTEVGPVAALLGRIDLAPLGGARDAATIFDARVASHDQKFGLTILSTRAGILSVPLLALAEGAALRVQVQARDVMLSLRKPEGLSALNVLPATVAEIGGGEPSTVAVRLSLGPGGDPLVARLTRKSAADLGLAPGMPVFAVIKSVALDAPGLPRDAAIAARLSA